MIPNLTFILFFKLWHLLNPVNVLWLETESNYGNTSKKMELYPTVWPATLLFRLLIYVVLYVFIWCLKKIRLKKKKGLVNVTQNAMLQRTLNSETTSKLAKSGCLPGKLYGMIKVYKTNFPARAVVSMVNALDYQWAKFLDVQMSKKSWCLSSHFCLWFSIMI